MLPATQTFFARAENVGRKPNGDDDIQYSRDGQPRLNSDLPAILEAWCKGCRGERGGFEDAYVADVRANLAEAPDGKRLDYQFHHPSRREVQRRIKSCAYPLVPLHNLCSERTQSVVPSQELAGTTILYTGLAQIEAHTGRAVQEPTPADSLKSQVRPHEPGDILFARMRPNLRKVVLVEFPEPGYTSPECAVLVPKLDAANQPIVDPLVLGVLLRSDFIYGQIVHLVAGIGRPRINPKELRDVLVPVPPAAEQAAIRAAYLSSSDEVSRLEEAAAAAQRRAKEVLAEAVASVAEAFAKPKVVVQ